MSTSASTKSGAAGPTCKDAPHTINAHFEAMALGSTCPYCHEEGPPLTWRPRNKHGFLDREAILARARGEAIGPAFETANEAVTVAERALHRLGWALMGYPFGWPFWSSIYRLGGDLHNWRASS